MKTDKCRRDFLKKLGILLTSCGLYPLSKILSDPQKPKGLKEAKYFTTNNDLAG